jgi:hypothetical protein
MGDRRLNGGTAGRSLDTGVSTIATQLEIAIKVEGEDPHDE